MKKITVALKIILAIIPYGWTILLLILCPGIFGLFKFLLTREKERTKRLEIESKEKIELAKEANRHKEYKFLNGK